ncbi:MAG: DUF1804 family protein [Gammaproteobacteria bacterium]|nr:DUF1804 family protein [Gammaproteobacteria bacterium]
MAHPQEIRAVVRRAYIFERLSLDAAADKADVSYGTARKWKREAAETGDDWDKARAASRLAESGSSAVTAQLLEDFVLLFQTTVEQIRDGAANPLAKAQALSQLADAYTKTMKAAGGGDAKLAKLAVALEVIEELAKFIREHYPHQLEAFAAILEPFGQRVSEVFG